MENKHEEPLTAEELTTYTITLGVMFGVTAAAHAYFNLQYASLRSARFGIATGIGVASYLATACLLSPRQEYIDDRTKTNS